MTLNLIIVYDVSKDLPAYIFGLQIGLSSFTTYTLKMESKNPQNICIYLPGGISLIPQDLNMQQYGSCAKYTI
jgi:hypothetical protein